MFNYVMKVTNINTGESREIGRPFCGHSFCTGGHPVYRLTAYHVPNAKVVESRPGLGYNEVARDFLIDGVAHVATFESNGKTYTPYFSRFKSERLDWASLPSLKITSEVAYIRPGSVFITPEGEPVKVVSNWGTYIKPEPCGAFKPVDHKTVTAGKLPSAENRYGSMSVNPAALEGWRLVRLGTGSVDDPGH